MSHNFSKKHNINARESHKIIVEFKNCPVIIFALKVAIIHRMNYSFSYYFDDYLQLLHCLHSLNITLSE